jgi:ribosomal protein L30E
MKRSSASSSVYYFANLTKKAVTVKVTFGKKETVYDLATDKKIIIAVSQNITVPASGYLIYSSKLVK